MGRNVNKYATAANKYARDVVSGRIPTCSWVQFACQRHIDDLKKSKKKNYTWKFEKGLVEKVCTFASNLVHIKGSLKGQKIILEPWQIFLLGCLFGWINKITGLRRYNDAYWEIPRKNGKSVLGAIIGLYLLVADNEPGAEIYSGASTEEQAYQVFRPAWLMAEQSPGFKNHFGIELAGTKKNPGTIYQGKTDSFFKIVIGKPGDGASVHGGLVDEYHEHKTDAQYDTLNTGMGNREQGLMIVITTAGTNTAGPCKKKSDLIKKILSGTIENDRVFGVIYSLDEKDDWQDFENWKKANPNFGASVREDFLRQQHLTAMQQPGKQNIIRCKHLNQWLSVDSAWMNIVKWKKCKDITLTIESVKHLPCVAALDLASKLDLAALMLLFWDETNFYVFGRYYLPKETVDLQQNQHYQTWEAEELLTVTPGAVTDFGYIEDDIIDFYKFLDIKHVVYDPFQATYLVTRLLNQGLPMIELGATVKNFSEPMKELEKMIFDRTILFNGDPVLTWAMANVVAHFDKKDNIFPNKEHFENKIDPVVALIMGVNIVMRVRGEPEPTPPGIIVI